MGLFGKCGIATSHSQFRGAGSAIGSDFTAVFFVVFAVAFLLVTAVGSDLALAITVGDPTDIMGVASVDASWSWRSHARTLHAPLDRPTVASAINSFFMGALPRFVVSGYVKKSLPAVRCSQWRFRDN